METTTSSRVTAVHLGVARSTLYYEKKRPPKDWELKQRIETVLRDHPGYGYRRVALALHENKKKVQRVMRLYGIKAYRRRGKKWRKSRKDTAVYPNLLLVTTPSFPSHVWVADFTHLAWKDKDVRVATTMEVYTRTIVGVAIATKGGTVLVTQSFMNALLAHPRPCIFHSDNGVEYDALSFRALITTFGVTISRSKKGCPWENGYQESFYNQFKVDLGAPNRFKTLGELVAEIYLTVHRHNTTRIHSALRMAPQEFARQHVPATLNAIVH